MFPSPRSSQPPHHPLRWWSDEQQSILVLALEKLLRAWEQDWGLARTHPAEDAVRCALACDAAPSSGAAQWTPVALDGACEAACELWWDAAVSPRSTRAGGAGLVRAASRPDMGAVLLEALFGSPSQPHAPSDGPGLAEIAVETAKAAWSDLWRRIGEALHIAAPTDSPSAHPDFLAALLPDPQCFKPWSGAVVVTLHWCGQELRLLVGGKEVEVFLHHGAPAAAAPAARSAPLVPLWDAVSPLNSTVRAELEPVELSLGMMKALRVGDVIELSHSLDMPLLAKTLDGEVMCEAFLGRSGGHRAIELLRTPRFSD